MKESKIKSFEAVIAGNTQKSWESKYGKTMFVFDLYMMNGDNGRANSTSQSPTWNKEDVYTYDYVSREHEGTVYHDIKQLKKKDQEGYKGGSKSGGYKMSPEKQKQIMCQVSMISANSVTNKLSEDYDTIVRQFLSFLILNGQAHDPISLQGALKIAAEYWRVIPDDSVTIEKILQTAKDNIIKTEASGKWNGKIEQSQSSTPQSLKDQPPSHQDDQLDQNPPEESGADPFLKIV